MKNTLTPARRDFLKKAGILVAGGSIISSCQSESGATIQGLSEEEIIALEEGTVSVNILQSTDVHCQIHPHDELFWENGVSVFRKTGGYAQMATFFEQERNRHPHTFIMDTGDMFQGSELSVKTTGEAMIPILNAMGYDLYLPGNWEVVYYKDTMQHLLGSLHAPKICANMYHKNADASRGELVFPPYHIWKVGTVKIGFLGYTDHLVPLRQSPNYSKGIIYTKPENNMKHYVDVLRKQEKCAAVIIIAHCGLSQQIAMSNHESCVGVDYILGGDTHERVRVPIQGKYAKVVEPGAFGSFVGKLQMSFEKGKLVRDTYDLVEITSDKLEPSQKIEAILKTKEEPFKEDIYDIVGYSTLPLYRYFVIENTIDTMILDALDWAIPEADIVLSNGFRFCPPRTTPDETGNIPITSGFIYDMLPVDSFVRIGEVTGAQIMEWLERELNNVFAEEAAQRFGGWVIKFKGMTITFNAFGNMGERVQEVKILNEPVDLNRTYTISACERDGDPEDILCRFRGVKNTRNTPMTLHEVMKSYLAANSPVTPTPPLNARVLDATQSLLTQVHGVDYEFR